MQADSSPNVSPEVADFFSEESELEPGLDLPDAGAIAVTIPEAPIQERMRSEAVAPSGPAAAKRTSPGGLSTVGSQPGDAGEDESPGGLVPMQRTAMYVGIGVGAMALAGLLYWLIQ